MSSVSDVSGDDILSIEPNTMRTMKPMLNTFNARLSAFEDELTEQGINSCRCYESLAFRSGSLVSLETL
jgi:hypothetical protein